MMAFWLETSTSGQPRNKFGSHVHVHMYTWQMAAANYILSTHAILYMCDIITPILGSLLEAGFEYYNTWT